MIMRWFLIQIVYNIGNAVKTDKVGCFLSRSVFFFPFSRSCSSSIRSQSPFLLSLSPLSLSFSLSLSRPLSRPRDSRPLELSLDLSTSRPLIRLVSSPLSHSHSPTSYRVWFKNMHSLLDLLSLSSVSPVPVRTDSTYDLQLI